MYAQHKGNTRLAKAVESLQRTPAPEAPTPAPAPAPHSSRATSSAARRAGTRGTSAGSGSSGTARPAPTARARTPRAVTAAQRERARRSLYSVSFSVTSVRVSCSGYMRLVSDPTAGTRPNKYSRYRFDNPSCLLSHPTSQLTQKSILKTRRANCILLSGPGYKSSLLWRRSSGGGREQW